jgi:long-chain acyl-CoA synthetase
MRSADFFRERFAAGGSSEAIVAPGGSCSYEALTASWQRAAHWLESASIEAGQVVGFAADYSEAAVAMLFALIDRDCILVPLYADTRADTSQLLEIARVQTVVRCGSGDGFTADSTGAVADHDHYRELRRRRHPGLVLFSSGTSGPPKAAVHDFESLLEKFQTGRPPYRTISFLLFDHIGGINTLCHTLSNHGALIVPAGRDPDSVCTAIDEHRAQLLPTTPTFLNLLLLSEAHRRHDLRSLQLITYGTEPMSQTTLTRLHAQMPSVRLLQTYGLAELGILRSRSRDDESLWMRVGGEGIETRVTDGLLEIRTPSAMLGYLNAPSPFTEDGWFMTGDAVTIDGDFIRVLGRQGELVNVGGEKVTPSEVEEVIEQVPLVRAATVFGRPNSVLGSIVCARVQVAPGTDTSQLRTDIKRYCRRFLGRHEVPMQIDFVTSDLHGERFKKVRTSSHGAER